MLTSSRSGDAYSVDRETDRVSWCCSESGRGILGLFVPPVTWCHCDLCCTRCIPYGQLGSDKEKRISYKPQIVSSFQIKHCCLSKKNELKIRAISILVKKEAPFTDNRESFFLDRAMPTTAFSFLFPLSPPFAKVKGWLLSVLKSRTSERKKLFLIPDSVLPCLLLSPAGRPVSKIDTLEKYSARLASIQSPFYGFPYQV